ncbi:MAG TPA: acetyl esterase, partial [Armatimonadota bacterium]|nr:acetyl esterase [Armatimonadota bacterium]
MKLSTPLATAAALGVVCIPGAARAEVRPNPLFSNNMVLQREMPVPVWGTAKDGEKVTVEFAGQKASTTAKDGRWMVRLRPLKTSSKPSQMTIRGENAVTIDNVLVGEVWIASGQSNMQWTLRDTVGAEQAIASSANPQIRLLTVPRRAADTPETEAKISWAECGPETVPGFSAV